MMHGHTNLKLGLMFEVPRRSRRHALEGRCCYTKINSAQKLFDCTLFSRTFHYVINMPVNIIYNVICDLSKIRVYCSVHLAYHRA